jgi:predicted nucleotidyltransferase
MAIDQRIEQFQEQLLRAARLHGAIRVRIFGSMARNQAHPGSDLDLLVDFEPQRTLLDAIALEQELSELLGLPVQVITPASLPPRLRRAILESAIPL